ncbi:Blp family class II bacteriocin [Clostridium perfringens]
MKNLITLENEELIDVTGGGWAKCIAGTVGGAVVTGLGGAASGSAVPVIGTGAGLVIGAIGGGLVGAATSC